MLVKHAVNVMCRTQIYSSKWENWHSYELTVIYIAQNVCVQAAQNPTLVKLNRKGYITQKQ